MFRDDLEALRIRADALEQELGEARDRLEELGPIQEERDRLRAKIAELEGKAQPPPALPPPSPVLPPRERKPFNWALVIFPAVLVAVGVGAWAAFDDSVDVPFVGLDRNSRPTIGMVVVDDAMSPAPIAGHTTGSSSAPGDCEGYIPDDPHLVLRTSGTTALRIAATSSTDLVLVVLDSDGHTYCNDDTNGSNPVVNAVVNAGDQRVWVGTYGENAGADFQLGISAALGGQTPDSSGLATSAPPSLGEYTVPSDGAQSFEGSTQGFVGANALGSACRGLLQLAPHLVMHVSARTLLSIDALGSDDLVLAVRAPDGTWMCDDDSGDGNQPRIAGPLERGRYAIWVGQFSSSPAPSAFRLQIAAFQLGAAASAGSIDVAPRGAERQFEGTLDGDLPASLIGASPGCEVYTGRSPLVIARANAPTQVQLDLGGSPGWLVIHHPDRSVSCVASTLTETWARGEHTVFVGRTASDTAGTPFTLSLRTTPSPVVPYTP